MAHPLIIGAAGKTERGTNRTTNEDNFRIVLGETRSVFVVADGLGGASTAEAASELAVRMTSERLAASREGTAEERIRDAVRAANRAIFDAGNADFRVRSNASTVALLLVEGDVAHTAHVGDSRVYLFRDGALSQLTEDHSLVNWLRKDHPEAMAIRAQLPEDAQIPPNVIMRALGLVEDVEVELSSHSVQRGDLFLLCTDGISNALEDARIAAILREAGDDLERAVSTLVSEARSKAGPVEWMGSDDVAVIVARVGH